MALMAYGIERARDGEVLVLMGEKGEGEEMLS